MMNYGKDIYLDNNRDVVFTPDGDVLLQSGPALVAQDVREELSIAFSSVEWNRKAGSHLIENLNGISVDEEIISELERVAIKDPRVDASTVSASKRNDGRFSLSFAVVDSLERVLLLFDLKDLLGCESNDAN